MWKAWIFVIGLLLWGWLWLTGNHSIDLIGIDIVLLAVPLFVGAVGLVIAALRSVNIF
ncbi:MAG TPA: hypothetical protein VH590_20985 [Ktedonobacterales bacterium]|jgi:hypothetical protein